MIDYAFVAHAQNMCVLALIALIGLFVVLSATHRSA